MLFLLTVLCDIVKIKMDGSDEYLVVSGNSLVVADSEKFYTFNRRPNEDGSGSVSLQCGDSSDFLSFDPSTGKLITQAKMGLSYSRFMLVEMGRGKYKILNGDRCVERSNKDVIHLTECLNNPQQIFNIFETIADDIHDVGGRFYHHHHHKGLHGHHVKHINEEDNRTYLISNHHKTQDIIQME